jgi:hypothetical protein
MDVVRILLTVVSSRLASNRKRFTEWTSCGIVEFISYALAAKSATPPILSTLCTGGKDAFNASAFSMDAPWIVYSRLHFPGRGEGRRENQSSSYQFPHVLLSLCNIFLVSTPTKPSRRGRRHFPPIPNTSNEEASLYRICECVAEWTQKQLRSRLGAKLVAWVSRGAIQPGADDFAMLWLLFRTFLPRSAGLC